VHGEAWFMRSNRGGREGSGGHWGWLWWLHHRKRYGIYWPCGWCTLVSGVFLELKSLATA